MKDTLLIIAALVIIYLISRNKKAAETLRAISAPVGNLLTTSPPVTTASPSIAPSTPTTQAPVVINNVSDYSDNSILTGQNDFNLSGSISLPA